MSLWSISDLHLALGIKGKKMDVFGPQWKDHPEKIASAWNQRIRPDDLVLIGGDTSWAKKLEDALPDLEWLDQLPGTKLIIRGNHDYWWPSLTKLNSLPYPTLHFLHNNAFDWHDVSIGGARLWDTDEFNFDEYITFEEFPMVKKPTKEEKAAEPHIFNRELHRLKLSLDQLNPQARLRIAMTHYPPIGADMKSSKASNLLEKYQIDICIFGHLHNVKPNLKFGEKNGVHYYLTSCDYLKFTPLLLKQKL